MKSILRLCQEPDFSLPPDLTDEDVRFPPSYARYFIEEYTKPGDLVFDPFAGFGTTLIVAEEIGRRALGLEYIKERAEFIGKHLKDASAIRVGDATKLAEFDLPTIDFSITSPPYTFKGDPTNPLTSNLTPGNGYDSYIDAMQNIYVELNKRLQPGGRVVVNIENNYRGKRSTMLAWDVARAIDEVLPLEREYVMERIPHHDRVTEHEYCLVFRKPGIN